MNQKSAESMILENEKEISLLDGAIGQNPNDSVAWAKLGAAMAFKDSLPQDSLGFAYFNLSRFAESVDAFESAISYHTRIASPPVLVAKLHLTKGLALEKLNRIEDALNAYSSACQSDSKSATAWNSLGKALAFMDRKDESLAAFEWSIKLDNKNPLPWSNLCALHVLRNRKADALLAIEEAIRLDPKKTDYLESKGSLLSQLGKSTDSIAVCRQILLIEPSNKRISALLADLMKRNAAEQVRPQKNPVKQAEVEKKPDSPPPAENPPPNAAPAEAPVAEKKSESILDTFGEDWTERAKAGSISEATGRDSEIDNLIEVLGTRIKPNPILLGEAGVGKTAIVEGLAWRIANGKVPKFLLGKRIIELETSSLVGGTEFRGLLEKRISELIKEASQKRQEIIIFIDEIHTLVSAGESKSGSGIGQMFKQALARGEISCIGATTQDEFASTIQRDSALERRFTPVIVNELSAPATLAVLEKVARDNIEYYSKNLSTPFALEPGVLKLVLDVTNKFMKHRNQPDKSIDVLDMAFSIVNNDGRTSISVADVFTAVSKITGFRAESLSAEDQKRYLEMESELSKNVKGQSLAISIVCRSIRASLTGLKPESKPMGVFLFMGPSGVGKTKLAIEIGRFLFGGREITRFDMAEFQDKHAEANLIGSSRGYLDSEKGGRLTEAIRQKPYSIVLLDEIEKANPDVFRIFLRAFDDGKITDTRGKAVNCCHCIFILTSNIGFGKIDFATADEKRLKEEAGKFLSPELVNRMTSVIGFKPLDMEALRSILDDLIQATSIRFKSSHNADLHLDQSVKEALMQFAQTEARSLEGDLEKLLVEPLNDEIIRNDWRGKCIKVGFKDGHCFFRVE